MAKYVRLEVLNEIYRIGLVPVFYHHELETAKNIVRACARGGAGVVEFTNRGDRAFRIFSDLVAHFDSRDSGIILGVGSVMDPSTASLYINCGANFIVGPNFNPEAAKVCNRRKVSYSPGCGSVSEISDAEELGVEIVKVFPGGQVGGPAFVKAVSGPMPWTRIMPTGGVSPSRESIGEWFGAGVACVGIGSKLVDKDLVARGDWDGISQKVADCIALIREARGG